MTVSRYRIDGMHCEGCAQTIEALVVAEAGVKSVSVSFREREARVEFDPQCVSEAAIAAAIERAGFKLASRR